MTRIFSILFVCVCLFFGTIVSVLFSALSGFIYSAFKKKGTALDSRNMSTLKNSLEAAVWEVPITVTKLPFVHNLALNFFFLLQWAVLRLDGCDQPINSEQQRSLICITVNIKNYRLHSACHSLLRTTYKRRCLIHLRSWPGRARRKPPLRIPRVAGRGERPGDRLMPSTCTRF